MVDIFWLLTQGCCELKPFFCNKQIFMTCTNNYIPLCGMWLLFHSLYTCFCHMIPLAMMNDRFLTDQLYGWFLLWWITLSIISNTFITCTRPLVNTTADIWGLWCQKQVSQAGLSNYLPQFTVGCNYLSLPEIPASGAKVLIYVTEWSLWLSQNWYELVIGVSRIRLSNHIKKILCNYLSSL